MTRIKTTLRHLAAITAFLAMTPYAHATSNIECSGIGADADVSILIGAGPVMNALEVNLALGKRYITTYPNQDGEHASIVQFQADEHGLSLDMMDDQAEKLLASIRLLKYQDQDNDEFDPIQIGYLRINGSPPVGITCEGP